MTEQSSCVDCVFKHRPSRCPMRERRKTRLYEQIIALRQDLDELERYDQWAAAGNEPESRYERWERIHSPDPSGKPKEEAE